MKGLSTNIPQYRLQMYLNDTVPYFTGGPVPDEEPATWIYLTTGASANIFEG